MSHTDSLTLTAYKLLSGHGHHHKHRHPKVKVPAQAEFHIGSFHHHISGDQIGYGLFAIIILVVLCLVVAGARRLLF